MSRSRSSCALASVTVGVLLIIGLFALWPVQFGGRTAYVTTHGISMAPRFHTGDLAVVRQSGRYEVGDVVAYRSQLFKTTVLHRIFAAQDGRYTFKGDNNSWLDPEQPTTADLVGKLAVRIPQGGIWLKRMTSPTAFGLLTITLLVGGGGTVQSRRRRRKLVSRHAAPTTRSSARLATQSPQLRTAAAVTATVGAVGLALGAFTWASPVQTQAPRLQQVSRSMTFSYTAAVPLTPAYDGTTVTSPDPVFRRLANVVDVHFSYQGGPGSVTVNAALTTANGWHATVPLTARKAFTDSRYDGTVHLDLSALERRAQAAAAATGVAADQLIVAVTAQVTSASGTTFAPALRLALSQLELKLADDPKSLTVTDSTAVRQSKQVPRTVDLLGRQLTVANGRTLSTMLLLVSLLVAVVLIGVARWSTPANEGAAIHRRYAPLLVAVHPMPTPAGRPVVDVTEFVTLVKLAERYGLLVLHWTRSDVETFVVQDEGTTYRYRTGAGIPERPMTDADAPLKV